MSSTCLDRSPGLWAPLTLLLALPACGDQPGAASTGETGASATDATTGAPTTTAATTDTTLVPTTDAASTGTSDATTSSSSGSSSTGGVVSETTTDSTDSTGTTGGPCAADTVVCDGDTAKVCDGAGGFASETDCAVACLPGKGCTECVPNAGSCDGEVATACSADGSEEVVSFCDGVQGVTCVDGKCKGACSLEALGTSYIGCDYYPTVTGNAVLNKFSFAVAVANTADVAANFEIDKAGALVLSGSVDPHSVEVVKLPWDLGLKGDNANLMPSVKVVGGAYRLRTDQPVTVYQYNPLEYEALGDNSFTNDASLLLPVNVWSGDYFVVARNTWYYQKALLDVPGFYAVTASEDDTTVVLAPSQTGKLVLAGAGVAFDGTGTITLDRGDVLEVFSAGKKLNPSVYDLSGTRVTADRPIQVISGHVCTNVPADVAACDHLEESMFPYETLAKQYIVTPPLLPPGDAAMPQMVRIVATADATSLTYDPPQPGAPATIAEAGQYVELALNSGDFEVSADHKIIVAQYMIGQESLGESGDPAMALSVATEQFRDSYLFHAPINYETNYVNITAPAGAEVELDGVAVAGFTPIGATGFGVARVKLGDNVDGNHEVTADEGVGISVYGYGSFTSYWYPGGLDLEILPQ